MRPIRPIRPLLLLLAPVLALVGCGPDDDSPTVDVDPAPLAGTYAVTSRFEVPATVAAPGPLGDALRLVHGLATDPGTALLDFAEEAGVPAVSELRLVLPDALESELTGWMSDHLESAAVDGVSPHDRIVELDDAIRSVLLRWELSSTLVLPAGAAGTHAPVSLAFDSPAGPVTIPLDATAPVTAGAGVTATVSWPDGAGGAAAAAVGEHAMGIPFGRYALRGLDAILLARYGEEDVRALLAGAVSCEALAASVAGRCVGFLCVGHEEELRDVCEGGLDAAAGRIEEEILGLDFQAIRFEQGAATAVGAAPPSAEGAATEASALDDGRWTATIDLGQGEEAATATFIAVRTGSAP